MNGKTYSGKLIIITGPSGSGKDTVISKLKKQVKFFQIITYTTRNKRPGERNGKPYYFVSKKKFILMRKKGEFFEWAWVYGNLCGSRKKDVIQALKRYPLVIIKPDPKGALTLKKLVPEATSIFITAPFSIIKARIYRRAKEKGQKTKERLRKVKLEIKMAKKFDYVVRNQENKLKNTVRKIKKIIDKVMKKK